eukprot:CAMPEP_0174251202 /NCGR_PEP_ID=MMETSP0439-20130205/1105_1 /TAXON_ID=0 /ORGANISM="Stereomyxa ramosa, Strain Chinc5" /LENGTH=208 /DNA_ID=CAMNT_0015331463 /DNA_START=13 /DNA_END=639 /DNA_ORIENTATION=+
MNATSCGEGTKQKSLKRKREQYENQSTQKVCPIGAVTKRTKFEILKDFGAFASSQIQRFRNPDKREDLEVGDHIYCWRYLTFKHHGVYVGDDRVVHFTKNIQGAFDVQETSLDSFLCGGSLYIKKYKRKSVLPTKRVVKNARVLVGCFQGTYDVFCFNCEHVASWCKTGKLKCEQLEKYKYFQDFRVIQNLQHYYLQWQSTRQLPRIV